MLMHGVWELHPLTPSSQWTRSHPDKAKSYEPKALGETMLLMRRKKKYHYFTHPAEDHTNFHLHFNQRERMGKWEKEETHARS